MAYNTGNPVGSTGPRDLSDNSENFDRAVNATGFTWVDRLGNVRTSLRGQVGYVGTGVDGAIEDYAPGQVLSGYNVIIRYSGEFYRASASATLPYTTTATLPDVDPNLVAVGDAVLRQDLANNAVGLGSDLVAHTGTSDTVTEALDKRPIKVDDVTALRALTGLSDGDVVYLSAYFSGWEASGNGPIGGGHLVADGSDVTSADNDGTIFITSDGVRVKRPAKNHILIDDFGGDLKKAVDWAATSQTKVIKALAGKEYLISETVQLIAGTHDGITISSSGTGIQDSSNQTAIFRLGFNGRMFDISSPVDNQKIGITFKNLTLEGDANNGRLAGTAIYVGGTFWARKVNVEHCYIRNFYDAGVTAEKGGLIEINQSEIFNNGINLNFINIGDSNISGGQSGSGFAGGASWVTDNIVILAGGNCEFTAHRPNFSGGWGLRASGEVERVKFVGGQIDNNRSGGALIEGNAKAIEFNGVTFFENGDVASGTGNGPAVRITASTSPGGGYLGHPGVTVHGCAFIDRNSGDAVAQKQRVGVNIDNVGGADPRRLTITDNNFIECETPVVNYAATKTRLDNVIRSNNGHTIEQSGVETGIDCSTTGVKTVVVPVTLDESLSSNSKIQVWIAGISTAAIDFYPYYSNVLAGSFEIKVNVKTASAGATCNIAWSVLA